MEMHTKNEPEFFGVDAEKYRKEYEDERRASKLYDEVLRILKTDSLDVAQCVVDMLQETIDEAEMTFVNELDRAAATETRRWKSLID
jgi:hypothetical protein